MAAEEAFQSGATALFEEKYGDRVRVVSLADFSKELCGGTHVQHTGDIGFFKIVTETSVAAGIRRIEAMTGEGALASVQQMAQTLDETARLLRDNPQNIKVRIEKMLAHQKDLEKELETLKGKLAARTAADAEADVREVEGVKVLARRVEADNPGALRDLDRPRFDPVRLGQQAVADLGGPLDVVGALGIGRVGHREDGVERAGQNQPIVPHMRQAGHRVRLTERCDLAELEQAAAATSGLPIAHLLRQMRTPVDVYWAP